MRIEPPSAAHGRRAGGFRWSPWLLLAVLAAALTVAQLGWVTPLDPTRGAPQNDQAQLLWVAGDYGTAADQVVGNRSVSGTSLTLNGIQSSTIATATWSISFPEAYDVPGRTIDYTLWLPATMEFARNSTPLRCMVDGHPFTFQPTLLENVSDQSAPVYVPDPNQTARLPGLFAGFFGDNPFVPFQSSFGSVNTTIEVELTVPSLAEVTLPNIVFSASPVPSSASTSSGELRGWAMLPVLAVGIAGVVWAFRKFWVTAVAATFALGIGLRLALAPLFLHTDLITLTQYPVLFYPYGIVNLQSFIYGPTWFLSLIAPASPFYAAGVTPSTDAFNVLFKLTPIAFDGLTYLVLLRLLATLRDPRTAYRWATFGWLLNPFVIWFSAVHGLDESVVAFFVTLVIYVLRSRRWTHATMGATLGVLTLYPVAFALPPLLALKRRPLWFVVAAVALPVFVMGALFLAVYQSVVPAIAYLGVVVGTTSSHTLPTYGSVTSAQSPWFLPIRWFGVTPSPLLGLAVVAGAFLVLWLLRRPVTTPTLPVAVVAALIVFFLSYETFFVQLAIWIVPALIVLLALRPRPTDQAIAFVLGLSLLALAINWAAPHLPYVTAVLSMALFALLIAPLLSIVRIPVTQVLWRWAGGVEAAAFLLALILVGWTAVAHPFPVVATGVAVFVAAVQGYIVVFGYVRPRFSTVGSVYALLTVLGVAGVLAYLSVASGSGGVGVAGGAIVLALLVALNSLSRVSWLTHLWLGADG